MKALLAILCLPAGALEPIRLQSNPGNGHRKFVDSQGRERIFHGTNAIVKGFPWYPDSQNFDPNISMAAEDFDWMQKLGLNVLRLGVMWPGYEPNRGEYNETYLDQIEKVVNLAAEHGVYTLLDMHQDGFSEHFCGEGFPAWAVKRAAGGPLSKPFPAPFDHLNKTEYYVEPLLGGAPRVPTRKACEVRKIGPGWHEVDQESSQAYQALWKNWEGIGDAWGKMWARVAKRFKGRPEILGLELINEPFNGDFYHDPLLIVPPPNGHNADKLNLQPAYDRVNAAVREVDEDVLIFFAGVTSDDFGPGFTAVPGGADFENRSVLAYHYYVPPQSSAPKQVTRNLEAAARLRSGAMLTETDCFGPFKDIAAAADAGIQSWAHWEWKSFYQEQAEDTESQMGSWGSAKTGHGPIWQGKAPPAGFQDDTARTYASAVAGDIVKMHFNAANGDFELKYDTNSVTDAKTEIFVWSARYPGGAEVDATAAGGQNLRVDYEGSSISVYSAGLAAGTRISVAIRARSAPAPAPPGLPCVFEVPFNFSTDVDVHTQLPDGDSIVVRRRPTNSVGNATIQVQLRNLADDWWKSITQHRKNKYLREIVSTQGKRTEDAGEIQVADLRAGDHFVLSKAKMLGIHSDVYCIKSAEDMLPNMTYTFEWTACSQTILI